MNEQKNLRVNKIQLYTVYNKSSNFIQKVTKLYAFIYQTTMPAPTTTFLKNKNCIEIHWKMKGLFLNRKHTHIYTNGKKSKKSRIYANK